MEATQTRETPRLSKSKSRVAQRILDRGGYKVLSGLFLILAWWLVSLTLPPDILPGPMATFGALGKNFANGTIYGHFFATMGRVVAGFAVAMSIGIVLGTFMGLFRKVEALSDMWVMVALTVPGLCYVIVSFMWFGLNEFSAIVSIAATAFPTITINIWESVKNIDSKLIDMSKVFNASKWERMSAVIIPQVLPYILASARFGLGVIWKVTVMVELLGRSNGVGYQLHYWFQMYNMAQVLAWTLFFTIIMLVLELVVLKQIEIRAFAWRPAVRF